MVLSLKMRFFSNFPSFLLNVILLALMFKSWYKANSVWHKLLMKKGIKFLKMKNQEEENDRRAGGGRGGGGGGNYQDE